MGMQVEFATEWTGAEALVLGFRGEGPAHGLAADSAPAQRAQRIIAQRGARGFGARAGEVLACWDATQGPLVLLALGEASPTEAGGHAIAALSSLGVSSALFCLGEAVAPAAAAEAALGATLRAYRFDRHRRRNLDTGRAPAKLRLRTSDAEAAASAWQRQAIVADAVHAARDLVNEPPNHLDPEAFASYAASLAGDGLEVTILDVPDLRRLGMGGLLAVGESSARPPRLAVLRWRGRPTSDETQVALVGKGITFDTGGLIAKPLDMMRTMKGDMAGAAAVVGALRAAARQRLKVNAVGVVALAENAISGSAYRPSDVIRTAAGLTVEITHTDAEGRLALMDAVWYARTQLGVRRVVAIGTVTGSGLFGLGLHYGGLFSEDEGLAAPLHAAGAATGERLWRLPVDASYDDELESDIADFRQTAEFMEGGDGSYVARLLTHAAGGGPLAFVEMCGLEFAKKDRATCPKGATGFGVRLLEQFLGDCT
jgi:leucyl aminopeptidase